jgi:hypothetical protein
MEPWKVTVLLASAVLTATPAAAQQVGTATAVNPLSESTPPGASTVALTVGQHIVHKERIHTTPSGTVQLLFLDKSTLSIAPNTNLLIDEYVYDPNANSGHMLISLTEGALRFVGGKLSHQGEAMVSTPAAAIGIRGGTATIIKGKNGTRVIDHYGVITIHNGAGTVVINRPGFVVTILNWNTPPGEPERVTEAEIAYFLRLLTSGPGQNGGVRGLHNVIIGECGNGPAQGGVGALQGNNCPGTPWVPTNTAESDAFQLIIQATQRGTGQTQQPGGRYHH